MSPQDPADARRAVSPEAWLARLRHAVEADTAPTWGLDLRAVSDGVTDARARAVIDLVMRIAESALSTGAPAAEVVAIALRLVHAYGLRSVHVDVTFTAISVCHHRGAAEDPVTMVRAVRTRSADYDRLARLQGLVADLVEHPVPVEEARARFDDVVTRPHRYRRWIVTAAGACLGATLAMLLNGSAATVLVAFLTAGAVDAAVLWTGRRGLAPFFGQVVGGAVPTAVALLLLTEPIRSWPPLLDVSPSIVVAGSIVMLLAGIGVVGAAQDAIDGYFVTAGARGFEVILMTLGIVVGILAVLGVGQRLDIPTLVLPQLSYTPNVAAQLVIAGLGAGAWAVASYAGPRTVLVTMAVGALGWAAFALGQAGGLSVAPSSALGGLAVGIAAQVVSRIWQIPTLATTTAGIVMLLPGLTVFRGLYQSMGLGAATDQWLTTLATAAGIGMALAAGVSLGTYRSRRPVR